LYPAAPIGTGLLVGSPNASAGPTGFGAEIAGALGRDPLLTLGKKFDTAEAGLIVAASPEIESEVWRALGGAREVRSDPTTLNLAHVERVVADARSEAIAWRP